jgi:hypothetical protein
MQDDQNPQSTQESVIKEPETEEPIAAVEPMSDETPDEEEQEAPSENTIVSEDPGTGGDSETMSASTASEDDEDASPSAGKNKALDIMQIENMINSQMVDIDKKRDDVKLLKSTFDDAFKNDAKYREFDDKVKEANRLKTTYKQAMMKDAAIAQANSAFLNGRDELKDMQMALSDYLKEYHRVTGLTQFETSDGQMLEIVQSFKLVSTVLT